MSTASVSQQGGYLVLVGCGINATMEIFHVDHYIFKGSHYFLRKLVIGIFWKLNMGYRGVKYTRCQMDLKIYRRVQKRQQNVNCCSLDVE